jgi:high-affinity nickel permease
MLEFAALAFGLGVKHSFDADHLIAVSNLLTRSKSLFHSVQNAVYWAGGHMLAASVITLLLLTFRDSLLPVILDKFEIAVAAMLIFLGLASISQALSFHSHRHEHGGESHEHHHFHIRANDGHEHGHMFGIGIVHGLASNDELLLLLTVSLGLATAAEMVAGVAIFSFGVALGMVAFSALFTLPIVKAKSVQFLRAINLFVGLLSVGYGLVMVLG